MNQEALMIFWDVQHGHASYIKTPNGKHIVIDLGIGSYDDDDKQFSPLAHLKQHYGVNRIDLLIITHPHLDHIDDILTMKALNMGPETLLRPRHLTNLEILKNIREQDRPKFEYYCCMSDHYCYDIPLFHPLHPNNPDNFGGMKITFFEPRNCNRNNFNNHSIISVFEFQGYKIVIPGDNQEESFEELFKVFGFEETVRNADILLAPHHGRDSGVHNDFQKLVNPKLTIISDGSLCNTSANPWYSANSRGMDVYKIANGSKEFRRTLTTNSDGEIFVQFGRKSDGWTSDNYMLVRKK